MNVLMGEVENFLDERMRWCSCVKCKAWGPKTKMLNQFWQLDFLKPVKKELKG